MRLPLCFDSVSLPGSLAVPGSAILRSNQSRQSRRKGHCINWLLMRPPDVTQSPRPARLPVWPDRGLEGEAFVCVAIRRADLHRRSRRAPSRAGADRRQGSRPSWPRRNLASCRAATAQERCGRDRRGLKPDRRRRTRAAHYCARTHPEQTTPPVARTKSRRVQTGRAAS